MNYTTFNSINVIESFLKQNNVNLNTSRCVHHDFGNLEFWNKLKINVIILNLEYYNQIS